MPDLLDIGERHPRPFGESRLGETRRNAHAQRAGHELEQCPAAGGIELVEPIGKEGRDLGGRCRLQGLDDGGEPRRLGAGATARPEQRDGFGGVPHIVAGEVEQYGIDARREQIGQDAPERQPEEQTVGQRGKRETAVGIGRDLEIVGKQSQLVVARGRVGEPVEKRGEGLHWSSSSRPTNASARPLRPVIWM